MKRLVAKGITVVLLVVALAFPLTSPAFAGNPHSGGSTGRPNKMCSGTGTDSPGNAFNAPGSPFNPTGNAGSHYAGAQPQNSRNGQAAQYDVACFQQTQH